MTLNDFKDLNIDASFNYLRSISKYSFKKMAQERINNYAFQKLLNKKESFSKLRHLKYSKLQMQTYLYDEQTTIDEKLTLFKWRISMEQSFGENFRGGRGSVLCPICLSHLDSQEEGFNNCKFITDQIRTDCSYKDLYSETIDTSFTRILTKISNIRKNR